MITEEMHGAVNAVAELIKNTDAFKNVIEAQKAYNEDAKIAEALTEYSVQQELLSVEITKEDKDEELVSRIQARIDDLYNAIVGSPVYQTYKEAADDYSAFYQEVVSELDFCITGKRSNCSGDCSSCGGCH